MDDTGKIEDFLKKHNDIFLDNFDDLDIIGADDPDLLRIEEIMQNLKKIEENES